jgi:hypothetical protein
MAKTVRFTVKDETQQRASFEFLHAFGLAMSQWARLERSLYDWFERASEMRSEMASAIFFGARGFSARAEMLESILEHAKVLSTTETEFLKEAIKKARQFSQFRNSIAHGEPLPNFVRSGDDIEMHYAIVHPKHVRTMHPDQLSVEDIFVAADNIHSLQRCTVEMSAWLRERNQNLRSPEECLAHVRALPNQAHLKNAPSNEESEPQPQEPSRPNKKAYRAEQAAKKAAKKK